MTRFTVRVWDGMGGTGDPLDPADATVIELAPGTVFKFTDPWYAFAVEAVTAAGDEDAPRGGTTVPVPGGLSGCKVRTDDACPETG